MLTTSNPAMGVFKNPYRPEGDSATLSDAKPQVMTIGGTVIATSILITICVACALSGWSIATTTSFATPALWGSMIGSLVVFLVMAFKKQWSPVLAPIHAALEGVFLGIFSAFVAGYLTANYGDELGSGVGMTTVLQAIMLTMGVLAAMLIAYGTRIIRPGKVFKSCIIAATGGIMLFYVVSMIGSLFGFTAMRAMVSIDNASPISIGFSLFVVAIASLNLVLDFELIEEGSKNQMPKYMNWYAGAALLVTLVWLYIEILRLLAKLKGRD